MITILSVLAIIFIAPFVLGALLLLSGAILGWTLKQFYKEPDLE